MWCCCELCKLWENLLRVEEGVAVVVVGGIVGVVGSVVVECENGCRCRRRCVDADVVDVVEVFDVVNVIR